MRGAHVKHMPRGIAPVDGKYSPLDLRHEIEFMCMDLDEARVCPTPLARTECWQNINIIRLWCCWNLCQHGGGVRH